MGQELFKSPLDGPLGHWQPDSPDVQSLNKLAFFLDQGMNNTKDCIACKPVSLDMPVHLRAPTLNEWMIDGAHLEPRAHAHSYIGDRGSMQLVAMQVNLTNIGTIDAVAGTFEVWLDSFIHVVLCHHPSVQPCSSVPVLIDMNATCRCDKLHIEWIG